MRRSGRRAPDTFVISAQALRELRRELTTGTAGYAPKSPGAAGPSTNYPSNQIRAEIRTSRRQLRAPVRQTMSRRATGIN
jgi:hypothetical protein